VLFYLFFSFLSTSRIHNRKITQKVKLEKYSAAERKRHAQIFTGVFIFDVTKKSALLSFHARFYFLRRVEEVSMTFHCLVVISTFFLQWYGYYPPHMGRNDRIREAQQLAQQQQYAKAVELLQQHITACGGAAPAAAATGTQDAGASVAASSSAAPSPAPGASSGGDVAGAGRAYRNMGVILLEMRQPRAALDALERGLAAARRLGDVRAEGKALSAMGAAYHQLGIHDRAVQCCGQAEELLRDAGHSKAEGVAVENAAVALASMGQYRHAVRLHERALVLAERVGDAEGVDVAQRNLEATYDMQERYEAALNSTKRSLTPAV
jgi:tetratricopeptide (TPR) repeat protein